MSNYIITSDYVKIVEALEEVADMEINLGSESGRKFLAQKIKDALDIPLSRASFIKSYNELTKNDSEHLKTT